MNASPSNTSSKRIILADRGQAGMLEDELLAALKQHDYSQTSAFAVYQAVQEALANAFVHGNRGEPGRTVSVEYRVDDRHVYVEVCDQGEGFDPNSVPDPTADENITIPAGRGIMLMRSFMTKVQFVDRGNCVRMWYDKP